LRGLTAVAAAFGFAASATAGTVSINYPEFASPTGLSLVRDAAVEGGALRVTRAQPYQTGAAWHGQRVPVAAGFDTTFTFLITGGNEFEGELGGDGFAFVIQDAGDQAVGGFGGFLGYASLSAPFGGGGGIPRSIAVEFDTFANGTDVFTRSDPNGNHVSIQSLGQLPNSADPADSLGAATSIPDLTDGAAHTARVRYRPESFQVFLDDLARPVLEVPIDLAGLLGLRDGRAYAGFTGGTGDALENHDILAWTMTSETTAIPLPAALRPGIPALILAGVATRGRRKQR
jgi:hypothetical protein